MSNNEDLARELVGLKQDLVWITFVLERLEKKVDLVQRLMLDPPHSQESTQSKNLI